MKIKVLEMTLPYNKWEYIKDKLILKLFRECKIKNYKKEKKDNW